MPKINRNEKLLKVLEEWRRRVKNACVIHESLIHGTFFANIVCDIDALIDRLRPGGDLAVMDEKPEFEQGQEVRVRNHGQTKWYPGRFVAKYKEAFVVDTTSDLNYDDPPNFLLWDECIPELKYKPKAPELEVDAKVWVRSCSEYSALPIHFKKWGKDGLIAFWQGRSSHTDDTIEYCWEQYSLDNGKTWYDARTHERVKE
jgi:hypothetical protein